MAYRSEGRYTMSNSTLKFLIVNGWSDMNRGDSAIVLGIIHLLQLRVPGSAIAVMSEFSDKDPKFEPSYQVIKSSYPDVKIVPALIPYPTGKHRLSKMVDAIVTLIRCLVVWALPWLGHVLFRGTQAEAWDKLTQSDVVISKGGHIFYCSQPSMRALYGFFKHAYPLLLGIRLRKRTALYAQSLGPFQGTVCQKIVALFFKHLSAISVREAISVHTLRNLGVTERIHLVPDAAFLLPVPNLRGSKTSTERLVVITPRQWGFSAPEVFARYIGVLARLTDWLATELGYSVLLVSHTVGPTIEEDDRLAVQHLYKAITSKERVRVIDTMGLDAYEMIKLYSSAQLLIGTRFHSVIFALLTSVPVVAISYFGPKTYGIMKSLELEQFVLDINDLDVAKLKSTIQHVLDNQVQIRKEIGARIKKLREEAERSGLALLSSVLKER